MLGKFKCILAASLVAALIGCGSGSSSSSPPPMETTVGGRVTGLASGNIVELELLVRDAHFLFDNVGADGKFTFGKSLNAGDKYDVVVATQPNGQTCTVANGSGYINSDADSVTNVVVTCSAVSGRFVYTTLEHAGKVAAYAISSTTGALTAVGSPVASGAYPMGVAVDPSKKFAYVTSYTENKVTVYSINSATGALTYASQVATNEGPKGVVVDPAGKFVYVAESGANKVSSYSIDALTGALTYAASNPFNRSVEQLAIASSGNYLFATTGWDGSVFSLSLNRTSGGFGLHGSWSSSPYASTNGVAVHPTGNFVYVAVGDWEQPGGLYVLSFDASQVGNLIATNGIAQSVAVDPTGKYLYATSDNTVVSYAINSTTGALTAIGLPLAAGSSPKALTVDGSGKYVYVANGYGGDSITAFSINATTGALTLVNPTISTGSGTQPEAITSF